MGRRRFGFLSRRKEERLGFFTMRAVDAASAEDAASEALAIVQRELAGLLRNRPNEPWSVRVDKIEDADGEGAPQLGFSWFPEGPE
jgi:hypothetical protein